MNLRFNEAAIFKWVLIVAAAAISVIALTLLTRPLVGALWGLMLVIAACVYAYRWWRENRARFFAKK